MKRRFALAAMVALVIAAGAVTSVPAVRAQVSEMVGSWFHFETPDGTGGGGMGSDRPMGFTPLYPTYVPAELGRGGSGVGGGTTAPVELSYYKDGRFVAITEDKASADKSLPAGRSVIVNGQKGVLVTGLNGTTRDLGIIVPEDGDIALPQEEAPAKSGNAVMPSDARPPTGGAQAPGLGKGIAFTDGKRLTWYAGDARVEMVSNLSEEEMLKIAESLVPMKTGGKPPVGAPVPPDQPSSGGEGVTRHGE